MEPVSDSSLEPDGPESQKHDWLDVASVVRGDVQPPRKSFYLYDEIPSEEPFRCVWHIERRAGGIAIEGHLAGDLLLTCDTCQQTFLQPLAIGIDELYVLSGYEDQAAGRERELLSDDFYEVVDSNGKIDLKDLGYQFLVMESTHHPECQTPPCASADEA